MGKKMDCSTILLMLAPMNPNQESLEIVSFLSSLIIKDDNSIQMFESANKEKIYAFISEQLHVFINSKFA